MNKLIPIIFVIFLFSCKHDNLSGDGPEFQKPILTKIANPVSVNVGGYYEGLPAKYLTNSKLKKYPIIICLHGAGAYGEGTLKIDAVLEYGVIRNLAAGNFPPYFLVGETYFSFIVLAPQFKSQPTPDDISKFLAFAKSNYQVDNSRIYIVGSSVGGRAASDYGAEFPNEVAAIVTMSGISDTLVELKCQKVAAANLPFWIFHNSQDDIWPIEAPMKFVDILNTLHPNPAPIFTIIEGHNHNSWITASDPTYELNGKNIYQWMLQYHR